MVFIDFGLLRSPYCKLSYLLTLRYMLKFDNVRMTQCAKIIVGFVANVGNIFIIHFLLFARCYIFFKFLSDRLLHLWLKHVCLTYTK